MISLTSDFHGASVIWVDDRAELTNRQVAQILSADSSKTEADLQPLNQAWASAILANLGHTLPTEPEKNFAAAATVFRDVCKQQHLNLCLMNFQEAATHAKNSAALFLFDLQNATKPLGRTSYDSSWNWSFYGAEFVKHFNIVKNRFRFLTRFRSEAGDPVKSILPRYFEEDTQVFAHSLRLEDLRALRTNFEHFVSSNTLHPDPDLNEAIIIATASFQSTAWEHNSLASGEHNGKVASWLRLKNLDGKSAKALLLGLGRNGTSPWEVEATNEAYPLEGTVLEAVCEKLGVAITTDGNRLYRLPTQPGLPFLMSLSALLSQMKRDKDFDPPTKIVLSRSNGNHKLRLELNSVDRNGNSIDMNHFEESVREREAERKASLNLGGTTTRDSEKGGHLTAARVCDLKRAEVCAKNIDGERDRFCAGTGTDAVQISFDRKHPAIVMEWRTNNV